MKILNQTNAKMKKFYLIGFLICCYATSFSQANIQMTSALAESVLLGNYDPSDFASSNNMDSPADMIDKIKNDISADSLKSYLFALNSFETRNTGSDTLSDVRGIGAARRWVHSKFEDFSTRNEDRLIPSYLQFEQNICDVSQHRNVIAVLPGMDLSDPSIIVIEAHMDSMCEDPCDPNCEARGMEDNGSGTALMIELARVMSQFSLDHTVVFMATVGEEQGLWGGQAFATYAVDKDIDIKAVFNNDVIGGVICGETSSAPSCPGLNNIDSTQVRLFSASGIHKQLARFVKLEYQEELKSIVDVPMMVTIMSAEDRTGRGGDHIPFRQRGFAAMRFTSANEHGNVNVSDPDYHDRQHTSRDILGVDTNGDAIIDSFFVNFNYLSRNTQINGLAATMAAIGPITPDFDGTRSSDSIFIEIEDPLDYDHYRVFVRITGNDFDTIYTLQNTRNVAIERQGLQRISVASVDENGIESLFSREQFIFQTVSGVEDVETLTAPPIQLLQNKPNPFDEATILSFLVHEHIPYQKAEMEIRNMKGQIIQRLPLSLKIGMNEVLYTHGYQSVGSFIYSLVVDGKLVASERMVFAN